MATKCPLESYWSTFAINMKLGHLNQIPVLVLVGFSLFFTFKRIQLDSKNEALIQSDAQIKLYQTVNYSANGLSAHDCMYPGSDLDPGFEFFPFDYPWSISLKGKDFSENCHFQYPFLFSVITLPIYSVFGLFGLTWFSLLMYLSLSFVIFYFYIHKLSNDNWILSTLLTGILISGYPIYSAYEYTETTSAVFLTILFFVLLDVTKNSKLNIGKGILSFLIGIVFAISPFLRSEVFIYFFFFGVAFLLFRREEIKNTLIRNRFLLVGFCLGIGLFALINLNVFGHIFGVRGKVSLDDMGGRVFQEKFYLFQDFFLGNKHKVGWLRSAGLLFILISLGLIFYWVRFKKEKRIFFWPFVSVFSLLVISIISPYNPGNLFAGLRFTDLSFYILVISVCVFFCESKTKNFLESKTWIHYLLLFLFGFQLFLQVRILKKFFPLMETVRDAQVELLKIWKKGGDNLPVLHKNLFDGLLISTSYLTQKHYLVINTEKAIELQKRMADAKIPGFHLIWYDGEKPYDVNVSREFFEEKINNRYDFPETKYQLGEEISKYGYKMQIFKLK